MKRYSDQFPQEQYLSADNKERISWEFNQFRERHSRNSECSVDSGLGQSLLSGSSSQFSSSSQELHGSQWSVLETPKSGGDGVSFSAKTPSRFVFRHGMISPICEVSSHESFEREAGPSSSSHVLSSTLNSPGEFFQRSQNVTDFRFDGEQISSLRGSGLIKIGSPETSCLQTPRASRRLERSFSEIQPGAQHASGAFRQFSAHPLLNTPPKPNLQHAQTPTKLLPFSPTHGQGSGDYLGGFTSLSTSTPVSSELFPDIAPPPSHHVFPSCSGLRPVPDSPLSRVRFGKEIPRTPTPIKRAMAAIECKRSFDTPTRLKDFQEIIARDPTLRKVHREISGSHDPAMNSNLTPSKMLKSEPYSPPSLLNDTPPRKRPKPSFGFETPSYAPQPMSSEWCKIVLGNTTPQRELTQKAKEVLGL